MAAEIATRSNISVFRDGQWQPVGALGRARVSELFGSTLGDDQRSLWLGGFLETLGAIPQAGGAVVTEGIARLHRDRVPVVLEPGGEFVVNGSAAPELMAEVRSTTGGHAVELALDGNAFDRGFVSIGERVSNRLGFPHLEAPLGTSRFRASESGDLIASLPLPNGMDGRTVYLQALVFDQATSRFLPTTILTLRFP